MNQYLAIYDGGNCYTVAAPDWKEWETQDVQYYHFKNGKILVATDPNVWEEVHALTEDNRPISPEPE